MRGRLRASLPPMHALHLADVKSVQLAAFLHIIKYSSLTQVINDKQGHRASVSIVAAVVEQGISSFPPVYHRHPDLASVMLQLMCWAALDSVKHAGSVQKFGLLMAA